MENKKTAVAYCRYSSERQTEQSIEGQVREIKEFAERENINVIDYYIDRATSGTTTENRFEFLRMIDEAKFKSYDYVIVYKLDRFARNRFDSAIYKRKLKECGKKVLSAKENISDTPEGIILEGMLEAYNEYFSAELSQKVKRGMRESLIKGKAIGRQPLGYKVSKDKDIIIDEKDAELVKYIFDQYIKEDSLKSLARKLNSQGFHGALGGKFTSNGLKNILTNPKYKGVSMMKTVKETSTAPAIISESTFEQAQEKLKRCEKRTSPHYYRWTGYIKCSCGGHYAGGSNNRQCGKIYYNYRCSDCSSTVSEIILEKAVAEATAEFLSDENIDKIAESAYKLYIEQLEQPNPNQITKKQLSEIDKQIENCVNAICSGINSDALRDKLKELESQKQELKETVAKQESYQETFLQKEDFKVFLNKAKAGEIDSSILINCMYKDKDMLTICFNLTNEANNPPLEQIVYYLKNRKGIESELKVVDFITPAIVAYSFKFR